jgi:hypothetical protein
MTPHFHSTHNVTLLDEPVSLFPLHHPSPLSRSLQSTTASPTDPDRSAAPSSFALSAALIFVK